MAQALLSDSDMGIGAAPAPAQGGDQHLSDADVGLSPAAPGALSNSQDDSWLSGAAKGTGTAVIKGLSHIPGTIGDLGGFADYLLARGVSAATGQPLEQVLAQQQAAKAEHGKSGLGRVESAIDPSRIMPTSDDISAPVLKRTGEYEPTSELGRVSQAGLETAIGALGPGGGAATIERGAVAATPRIGLNVLKTTAKAAPMAATAGAVGQGVTDATGDPLLGMAAGLGVTAAGGAAASAAKKAIAPFAEDIPVVGKYAAGTRDKMVGQALLDAAENPQELEHTLFPGPRQPNSDEIVPGSVPTTGQLTGDMGILRAEGEARRDNNTAFNTQDAEQNAARRQSLEKVAPNGDAMTVPQTFKSHLDHIDSATQHVVDHLSAASKQGGQLLGPGSTPEANGSAIRQAIESVKTDAKAARSALYKAVDPDDTLALVSSPVRDAAQKITGNVDPFGRPMAGEEARIFSTASQIPDTMKFNSLHAFEQDVTAAMSEERRAKGETPTYARLSQLKGAVQDAIHTAVENQARHQEAGVLTGQMAPEQTAAARIRDWQDAWYNRQAEARANDAAGAGSNAGGRSTTVLGSRGAAGQAGERFGNPASDQGLSADDRLQPNFDQGAADRLGAAKAAHADYTQTFKQGAPGQILKDTGFKGQYAAPDSAVPAKAFVRGDTGYTNLKSVLKAAKNSPAAISAVQDQALAPLRATLAPDGSISQAALTRWKQAYGPALRAVDEVSPRFSSRFDNAATATDQLVEAGAKRKALLDEYQKSTAAKFLGASTPTEVENRLSTILKSPKDGPRQMRQLVTQAASDPAAIEGLRKAGADWIVRNFSASAEAGVSGQKDLKSASFQTFLRDTEPALRALYTPQQINVLKAVAADLEQANRTVTATRVKGSPGTAKDLAGLLRKIPEGAKHSSLMTAGAMAAMEAYHRGGPWAAALAAGLGAGGYVVHTLRAAGINSVQDMFRDALLNPERARFYISKVEPHPNKGPLPALSKALRRELVVHQVTNKRDR